MIYIELGIFAIGFGILQVQMYCLRKEFRSARKLIAVEIDRKSKHAAAFERLTDVDALMEDMERGADIIEARNANRLTKVRLDAGPPAKVYRPKLRSKLPSPWNPPHT